MVKKAVDKQKGATKEQKELKKLEDPKKMIRQNLPRAKPRAAVDKAKKEMMSMTFFFLMGAGGAPHP